MHVRSITFTFPLVSFTVDLSRDKLFQKQKSIWHQTGADLHHSLHWLACSGCITSVFLICGVLTLLSHRNHLFNPVHVWGAHSSLSQSLFGVTVQPSESVTVSPPPPVFLFCLCSLTIIIKDLIKTHDALFRSPHFPSGCSFWCSSHLY